jgi:glucans biosynthesis protein
VFQGASYFRAIANGQTYGLSARGLAIGTGEESGEEFPEFTHFWVEAPAIGAKSFVVHALLNGPSVTGAYSFVITPGTPTDVQVSATVFARVDVADLGIAPLTSMFLFDETNRNRFDDFRPAVHDNDGLLMWNGNHEMLWRPLANPTTLQVSQFADTAPMGFGLMQRARHLDDFADFEAHYESRPSLWITPHGDWGKGSVRLVEIPSTREIYDNIVAYWEPATPLAAGASMAFSYGMGWGNGPQGLSDVAQVLNTRIGKGFDQVKTVVAIDFAAHPALDGDLTGVEILLTGNPVAPNDGVLQRNSETEGARLAFSFVPEDKPAIEFRAELRRDGKTISEVWLYRWTV